MAIEELAEDAGIDAAVMSLALRAYTRAACRGLVRRPMLGVVDYSRPSSEPRLWLFDLSSRRLLLQTRVAHGKGSGVEHAQAFSNRLGSGQTSLGVFVGAETYVGKHGASLRLDGLEPGFNDLARRRAVVVHGADYVSESFVNRHGRLGRSLGCPAVSREVAPMVIDALRDGSLLFSYFPEDRWLTGSDFLAD